MRLYQTAQNVLQIKPAKYVLRLITYPVITHLALQIAY